jgi:cysteinyl-tRNA synthetase
LDDVLKIFDFEDAADDPDVQRLIKEREQARLEKNWKLADKIRDQLEAMGITIKDQKISNS